MFREGETRMSGKKYLTEALYLVVFATATYSARPVFILSKHVPSSEVQPYSISGDYMVRIYRIT